MEDRLARPGVAHRRGVDREQHAVGRVVVLDQRLVAAHAHVGGDVVGLRLADQRVDEEPVDALERRLGDVLVRAVDRVARLEADDRLPAALGERRARLRPAAGCRARTRRGARAASTTRTGPGEAAVALGEQRRDAGVLGVGRAVDAARPRARRRARRSPRPSARRAAGRRGRAARARRPRRASTSLASVTGMLQGRPSARRISSTTRRQSSEPWKPRSGLKPPDREQLEVGGLPRRSARPPASSAARSTSSSRSSPRRAGRRARLRGGRSTRASWPGTTSPRRGAGRTRPCPGRPSARRGGPRPASPAACSACSRSTGSSGRAAGCRGRRARGCRPRRPSSVQSASGFAFTRPNFSSHSTFFELARVGAWSRRTPVIQAST